MLDFKVTFAYRLVLTGHMATNPTDEDILRLPLDVTVETRIMCQAESVAVEYATIGGHRTFCVAFLGFLSHADSGSGILGNRKQ